MLAAAVLLAGCSDTSQLTSPSESSLAPAKKPAGSNITIISLGTLGGSSSVAQGINDKNQIVGYSTTNAGAQHAFVWQNDVFTDLGVLTGASGSLAYDINEAGVVVGQSGSRSVRWLPNASGGYAAAEDLGSLGGTSGDAQAVNDGGQITGSSQIPSGVWHAYLWQTKAMSDIHPVTLFGESDQTFPWGINNAGAVVGQRFEQLQPSRGFYLHSDGSAELLAGLGGAGSVPIDINDAGTIVGWSQATPNDQGPWHATLWSNGAPQDLGTLGGASSVAIAISDGPTPRVVGRADIRRAQHAFVWTAGEGMKDLGLPKNRSFGQAWDINSSGWIVGETSTNGGQTQATLWKLPAP
jgi:probable HAF family extracellular repeat protein